MSAEERGSTVFRAWNRIIDPICVAVAAIGPTVEYSDHETSPTKRGNHTTKKKIDVSATKISHISIRPHSADAGWMRHQLSLGKKQGQTTLYSSTE